MNLTFCGTTIDMLKARSQRRLNALKHKLDNLADKSLTLDTVADIPLEELTLDFARHLVAKGAYDRPVVYSGKQVDMTWAELLMALNERAGKQNRAVHIEKLMADIGLAGSANQIIDILSITFKLGRLSTPKGTGFRVPTEETRFKLSDLGRNVARVLSGQI